MLHFVSTGLSPATIRCTENKPYAVKYRNVVCLYPYFRESSAAMGFFPPTGLEHVAAAIERHVGNITLVDLRQDREFANRQRLYDFIAAHADLVCISVNWHFYFDEVCDLINGIPESVDVVVGGQHATDHVQELFDKCSNLGVIVRGEGEETIQEIVCGHPLPDILGISYRNERGITHNPNRPLSPAETLRYPNRSLRRGRYYPRFRGVRLARMAFDTVLTARGCPYNCKFCTFTINPLGQKRTWSPRSPESVVEEIATLDAEVIFFADDNLFADPKRISQICDLLLARNIRKRYIAQARLEIYKDTTLLQKAAAAGFTFFLIGIESPHDRILEQMNKGFNSAEVRKAFSVLREFPFYYHCYFIYGNVEETEEEMLYIPQFAREIGAHSISFQQLQARKFSPIRELVGKTPGYYLGWNGTVYSSRISSDRMRRIRRRIRRGFYTPRQLLLIAKTVHRLRIVTATDLLFVLSRLPALGIASILRKVEKLDQRRRRFIKRRRLARMMKVGGSRRRQF